MTQAVLIIEPNFTGHRWRYAQWAAQAFEEAGLACVIATMPSNEDHPLARKIVEERRPGLEIAFVDSPPPAPSIAAPAMRVSYARYHRYFAHAFARVGACMPVSLVVVPYVDYFLYALPLLGSPFDDTPWIGITMRATFHHRDVGVKAPDRPLVNAIKARLFRRAVKARGLNALLSIDPTLPEWSTHALARSRSHATIAYLADPFPDARADDPAAARSRLNFGPGPHLLVYGSMTDRKGIRELVTALEHMAHAPTLVVAGEQDESMRAFLRSQAPRLTPKPIVIDRFITDEVEFDLFSACDVVWLGYKGHYGMSGVLVQAYRFGKRVVATSEGLIGWFCAGGKLGPVLDDLSPKAIVCGIAEALAEAADAGGRTILGSHGALLALNTLDAFKRTLRDAAAVSVSASVSAPALDE
ncbi:glycosyltransferase [Trinickia dinghuensis]|uniref:Glycosyltransferase n=1 Tax=Trinickia dinghuensis TaxID=2291023 RepID=A0A3D8JT97_9BURK|nr:glycosyltransferase [Trinickia dinghuensis]RDU95992.1 glycosyltransferase [Trinickia dinghuensis]